MPAKNPHVDDKGDHKPERRVPRGYAQGGQFTTAANPTGVKIHHAPKLPRASRKVGEGR